MVLDLLEHRLDPVQLRAVGRQVVQEGPSPGQLLPAGGRYHRRSRSSRSRERAAERKDVEVGGQVVTLGEVALAVHVHIDARRHGALNAEDLDIPGRRELEWLEVDHGLSV